MSNETNESKYGARFSGNLDQIIAMLTGVRDGLIEQGYDLSEAPVRMDHTVDEDLPLRYTTRVTVFVKEQP